MSNITLESDSSQYWIQLGQWKKIFFFKTAYYKEITVAPITDECGETPKILQQPDKTIYWSKDRRAISGQ